MPYEIEFDNLPAGHAAEPAKSGDTAKVITREFTSSEDGERFVSRLEGFPDDIISRLPSEDSVKPSQVDHLLAVIRPDSTASVYINELRVIGDVLLKHNSDGFDEGEPIRIDDIAEISSISFENVDIPDHAGFVFLFSVRWRKGIFYDLAPLHGEKKDREYDTEKVLAGFYSYVTFQNLFKLTDDDWGRLFDQQWFPFISLSSDTLKRIVSHTRSGWPVDDLLGRVESEVRDSLDDMVEKWKGNQVIADHIELIERAVERYKNDDFLSATSILYPRIEGIMRSCKQKFHESKAATQSNLAESIIASGGRSNETVSFLLPDKFKKFLDEVYFADFEPGEPAPVSRNSVAHGVAETTDFSLKAATIALLTIDQIYFHLPNDRGNTEQ